MFFENVNEAAKDPILGLSEEFNKDKNPNKVNLAVGVYQDDNGKTTTFESVLEAEKILLDMDISKSYKPIDGDKGFVNSSIEMVIGKNLFIEPNFYPIGLNTPGGNPASSIISAKSIPDNGAISEGFSIIVQPLARAGITFKVI